jgi:hypothetical protein
MWRPQWKSRQELLWNLVPVGQGKRFPGLPSNGKILRSDQPRNFTKRKMSRQDIQHSLLWCEGRLIMQSLCISKYFN